MTRTRRLCSSCATAWTSRTYPRFMAGRWAPYDQESTLWCRMASSIRHLGRQGSNSSGSSWRPEITTGVRPCNRLQGGWRGALRRMTGFGKAGRRGPALSSWPTPCVGPKRCWFAGSYILRSRETYLKSWIAWAVTPTVHFHSGLRLRAAQRVRSCTSCWASTRTVGRYMFLCTSPRKPRRDCRSRFGSKATPWPVGGRLCGRSVVWDTRIPRSASTCRLGQNRPQSNEGSHSHRLFPSTTPETPSQERIGRVGSRR